MNHDPRATEHKFYPEGSPDAAILNSWHDDPPGAVRLISETSQYLTWGMSPWPSTLSTAVGNDVIEAFQSAFAQTLSILAQQEIGIGAHEVGDALSQVFMHVAARPQSPLELQKVAGLSYVNFSKLIEMAVEARLVTFRGKPGEELVALTPVAEKLLKPA